MKKQWQKVSFALVLATSAVCSGAASTLIPSKDPFFSQQWSLHNDGTQTVNIDVDDLHTLQQKGKVGVDIGYLESKAEVAAKAQAPVVVAVIDFGVDPNHPDLQGRLVDGYNFIDDSATNMYDEDGHGTHVSGIIAANADNNVGISGIAPAAVKVMPLKILSNGYENFAYKGKLISEYAADAIRYATAHGASVINMSLGWPKLVDSSDTRQAVQEAIDKGVIVVVAAGNDRKDKLSYPCAYDGVICVGAITNTGNLTLFSNMGGAVDILAPGDSIISTIPTSVESLTLRIQGYEIMSGTSQASPEVAAVAAILKSTLPGITSDEIKARLLVSGQILPQSSAALYGLVNIPRALHAVAQPVYVPDFKSLEEVLIDENTLKVSSTMTVKNLWATAGSVTGQLLVNGKAAGQASLATLTQGQALSIPWTYQFSSLDESAEIKLSLQVSDSSGKKYNFASTVMAARPMQDIKSQKVLPIPPNVATVDDWMGSNVLGHRYAKISPVQTYGSNSGYPLYYRQINADPTAGSEIQLFDTSSPETSVQVAVPAVQTITQVMRLDVNQDGHLDWVIMGIGQNKDKKSFYQFYFLGPNLKPLWGAGSQWQVVPENPAQAKSIPRSYAKLGSWIRGSNGRLLPCFLGVGPLPVADNFDSLDPRNTSQGNHLFYMKPDPKTLVSDGSVQIQMRAVDNADLYRQHVLGRIVNPLPQTSAEMQQGRLNLFFAEGQDLTSTISILKIANESSTSLVSTQNWSLTSTLGQPIEALTESSSHKSDFFLSFIDSGRGTLSWLNPTGQLVDSSSFTYKQALDPVQSLIGAHDLPGQGRVWFVETRFNLIGYHETAQGLQTDSIPLDRDSSFLSEEFDELFQAVVIGTTAQPVPGLFVDSTLVRGSLMSTIIWNMKTGKMERPLRNSLSLPDNCLQMTPVHLDQTPQSFVVPLLCNENSGVALHFVSSGQ